MKSLLLRPRSGPHGRPGRAHRGRAHRRERPALSAGSSAAAPYAAGPATSTTWRTAGPQAVEGDGPGALGLLPGVRALQVLPGTACTEAVPWARHGARFTRDFEDWVAWLAVRCTASAVSELARVEWHSVGGVCRRVYAELEAARGASRFDGVRHIGIDETSYKKGHKYVTVVVDHDRGCLIWAHEGTGKDVLNLFLDELTREQRRAIEVVTADGARWIRAAGQTPLPQREVGHGPLPRGPVDERRARRRALRGVERRQGRRQAARPRPEARAAGLPKASCRPRRSGRSRRRRPPSRGSRYALVKNPEDLTDGQRARLEALKKRAGSRLVRAWELKEDLRAVFRAADAPRPPSCSTTGCTRAAYCKDRQRSSPWRRRCAAGGRHHRRSRARHQQRARRGHQQQIKVAVRMGYGFPQHRQPRGPAHAQVRRLPAPAPGSPGEGEEEGREGSEERCCLD